MIKELIFQWELRKTLLLDFFKNSSEGDISYENIFKFLFEYVIIGFNNNKITIINDSEYYSGTLIFIIPKDCLYPAISDYIYTNNYYGSCAGCDQLEDLKRNRGNFSEENLNDLMTLSLHLVQKCKYMGIDDDE